MRYIVIGNDFKRFVYEDLVMRNTYEIIRRYRDILGSVTRYDLKNQQTGKIESFTSAQAIIIREYIINAKLRPNGEFVANKGYTIETKLEANSFKLTSKKVADIKVKADTLGNVIVPIGLPQVKTCRRIRKDALANRIQIDLNPHVQNEGRNTQLFDLIKSCGVDVKEFVRYYLSNLQPYALEKNTSYIVAPSASEVWVTDIGYGVELWIKMGHLHENCDTLIISFHESNLSGNYVYGKSERLKPDSLCAVFPDKIGEKELNAYPIEYTIQRGFIVHRFKSRTEYIRNDIAVVPYREIADQFASHMNATFEQLKTMYYDVDNDLTEVATVSTVSRLSFLSLGHADLNNIVFLVELFNRFERNVQNRRLIADIAIGLIDEIPTMRKQELLEGLKQRFPIETQKNTNELYKYLLGEKT